MKITDLLADRIREFIARGGAFFACGKNAAEKFGPELGIEYQGDSDMDPVYFRMNQTFGEGLDDMFLSLYAPASKAALKDAQAVSYLVKPYYNRGWNGEYAIYYTPPQEVTEIPFLTVKGKCVWCSGDLFSGYYHRGALHLRDIFRNIVTALTGKMLFVNETLPAFVRAVLSTQPNRLNVHLIAYAPERRGETTVVEDAAAVLDGRFKVQLSGRKVKSVVLAPCGTPLEYTVADDYAEIVMPPFKGYALAVIELE